MTPLRFSFKKDFVSLIFDEAKRTYPLIDRTSAFCTSLASSVESLTLTTLILVHSIDRPETQLHYLPWMFLQFLLCVVAQKMLKAFLFFTSHCIHTHQEKGSQLSTWIYKYIIYPHIAFIQTSTQEPQKFEPFTYIIFSGFWFLLYFLSSEI